ncbi:MAG: hypothetical protein IT207_08140 [Fimbriimonadaceae bacterium]|nr:hypothetical protein [Fimbriimonadaceae bacterium]
MAITTTFTENKTGVERAYHILHLGFIAAPLLAGADKFFNLLTDWTQYLAPQVATVIPAQTFMKVVGAVEIVAAIVVAVAPRFGGYLVAAWLGGIIVNLLMIPGHFDTALRDLGLLLGALALAQLAPTQARHANN